MESGELRARLTSIEQKIDYLLEALQETEEDEKNGDKKEKKSKIKGMTEE